ncbi:hypothetical protein CDAR_502211 [Caerostris darwini]|uniref:Uncharacterized protein n=1 Tax=Caerostris darwini TaxID=1538125 RepID=A0AAV4R3H6_9ARAC|nr:hypothetical protein CDAR_502211 [Caerostris darwini]
MPQGSMPRTAHIGNGEKGKGKSVTTIANPDFSNQSSNGTWNRGKRNLIYGKSFCEFLFIRTEGKQCKQFTRLLLSVPRNIKVTDEVNAICSDSI